MDGEINCGNKFRIVSVKSGSEGVLKLLGGEIICSDLRIVSVSVTMRYTGTKCALITDTIDSTGTLTIGNSIDTKAYSDLLVEGRIVNGTLNFYNGCISVDEDDDDSTALINVSTFTTRSDTIFDLYVIKNNTATESNGTNINGVENIKKIYYQ